MYSVYFVYDASNIQAVFVMLNGEGKAMKSSTTMSPQKRERYAQWLRNTGVEHPSDELIGRTRDRALSQIDTAREQKRRNNLRLLVLISCCLLIVACLWIKL